MTSTPPTLYLIDGSGFIFRAFHALPFMTRADGTPVNAVLGFTNMLMKLLKERHADRVAVIFDAKRHNWRNNIYPDYKAHRPPPPPELIPQFALIREATTAFNLPCIELEGYEADDLIATYARLAVEKNQPVMVVSSDKDLMQLIRPGVQLLDPLRYLPIGPEQVLEKFGVVPDKVGDVLALAGDSVDNVPGVPGIGVKTAAQLINDYGDLDTLLARAGEIKQPKRRELLTTHADQARISRQLVRLEDNVPVPVPLENLHVHTPDPEKLKSFLYEQGFKSVLKRLENPDVLSTEAPEAEQPAPSIGAIKRTYELIQSVDQLKTWIDDAYEHGTIAVDTETDSLDALQANLVGISLSLGPGRACYIPVGHINPAAPTKKDTLDLIQQDSPPPLQIRRETVLQHLQPLLEDPSVLKVGQNLKYDMNVLSRYGIRIMPYDDTMVISYSLDAGLHSHGMDELAKRHLGETCISYDEVTGTGKSRVTFDRVPLDKALAYSAEDADITLRLHAFLKPRLVKERLTMLYETIERPLIAVVADMEQAGVKVDTHTLASLSKDFARRMGVMEATIYKSSGQTFNVGSPKQLGEVLFDHMKLPGGVKGKTGAYSTDSGVLEELAGQGHVIASQVLEWRQLAKLKSTYADALQEQINPNTGRVHTSFSLATTTTGRLSSTDPNLQNIPIRTEEGRKIRKAFIAESGHVLISVDYSQIELRLAAHMADVAGLKEAFHHGIDIHAATASQVFDVPLDQMTSEIRRKAKAINFGILYGMGGHGLGVQLGISTGEANDFIRRYLQRYPELNAYMERTKEFCRAQGYVETLFGRRCHIPGINDKNGQRRAAFERQAINAPLQGTAADIIKRAMVRLPDALRQENLQAKMVLQVHDELLFEAPESEAEKTAQVVKNVMESTTQLSVPLLADAGIGPNWDDAH